MILITITAKNMIELIESNTKGKYKINLFPSGQLGNENEMIKNLTMGSMDLGIITNAPTGAFIKPFMALDLPFIFPNEKVAHAVLDGKAGRDASGKAKKAQYCGVGVFRRRVPAYDQQCPPIYTPEDTKGIKFRVMTTPIYIGLFQSLGSNAVPMPWGEVFTAVQQKVIDGLEIPIPVIYASKYYEVTKYLSLTGHTYSPLIIMCSEQRWKKLSSGEKEIFQKAAREAAAFERNKMKDIIHDVLNKIKATGMMVNEVPDKKPFQEAVKPLYTKFEGEIGKDVLEAILKARDAAK